MQHVRERLVINDDAGHSDVVVTREAANDAAPEDWRSCGAARGQYEETRGTALVAFGEYLPPRRDA